MRETTSCLLCGGSGSLEHFLPKSPGRRALPLAACSSIESCYLSSVASEITASKHHHHFCEVSTRPKAGQVPGVLKTEQEGGLLPLQQTLGGEGGALHTGDFFESLLHLRQCAGLRWGISSPLVKRQGEPLVERKRKVPWLSTVGVWLCHLEGVCCLKRLNMSLMIQLRTPTTYFYTINLLSK